MRDSSPSIPGEFLAGKFVTHDTGRKVLRGSSRDRAWKHGYNVSLVSHSHGPVGEHFLPYRNGDVGNKEFSRRRLLHWGAVAVVTQESSATAAMTAAAPRRRRGKEGNKNAFGSSDYICCPVALLVRGVEQMREGKARELRESRRRFVP